MTDKKDLKRRIRERMAKTGESYTAARQHVIARVPSSAPAEPTPRPAEPTPPPAAPNPPFDVVEPLVLDELTASLGFRCAVRVFPAFAAQVAPARVLITLRDSLLATEGDASTQTVRAVAFRGEPLESSAEVRAGNMDLLRQYLERVRAGIAGPSPLGTMLALSVEGTMVLIVASRTRATTDSPARPLLWIHSPFESIGTHKIAGLVPR